MRKILTVGTTLAASAVVALACAGPASATTVAMCNDPAHYSIGYCSGPDVNMTYYLTDDHSLSGATYYDQYSSDAQYWSNSWKTYYANSDNRAHNMLNNFVRGYVRVRADHYVTTNQGPNC
jgi:hypothetical protein